MQTTSFTRGIGGAIGAALFALGLFALAPNTDAAQDQTQTQGERSVRRGAGLVDLLVRWPHVADRVPASASYCAI